MKKILIQLDTDSLASTFDRVVAVDADVDELFSYGGITPENVVPLVHGAIFTRGPQDLKNTAIFLGGSNSDAAEAVLSQVQQTFFGPMRISLMFDPNGSVTTAAAAVLSAGKHLDLSQSKSVVLGGTGPVGYRACQLLARSGGQATLVSRSEEKAAMAAKKINDMGYDGKVTPAACSNEEEIIAIANDSQFLLASGAAGVQFLSEEQLISLTNLKVAIDLNAVPPVGLGGIDVMSKAKEQGNIITYGAIGVGGLKMKIHKAGVRQLFKSNSQVLETETLYELGQELI
ncbi:Bifunctional protein MdtA [Polystyrenella longa]|uniref:Bifunctional protein MdtA n=1 Tax=Polystyrenella longa TaxID=2528007 RepID=A0A518CMF9_9PLAN|nr:NADP-dependent methylenetetrahydromethanopterin/methylenetetrahydrofolate dehydrogenase [Polystyrenella longa]QDU80420.1 Bifunctional protein MdtA [Polystyrenella longa]